MVKRPRECSQSLRNYRVFETIEQQEDVILPPLLTSSKLERRVRLVARSAHERAFVDHKRPLEEVVAVTDQQMIVSLNPRLRSLLGLQQGKKASAILVDASTLEFTLPSGAKRSVQLKDMPECTMVLQ